MTRRREGEELERIAESAHRVANDGYKLFRLNLIIIGVILSVSAYITQNASLDVQKGIIVSVYTQAAAAFLLLSIIIGFLTYEPARRLSAMWLYDDPESIVEKQNTSRLAFNIRYGMFLSLASATLFGIGVLDAYLPVGVEFTVVWGVFMLLIMLAALPILVIIAGRSLWNRAMTLTESLTGP